VSFGGQAQQRSDRDVESDADRKSGFVTTAPAFRPRRKRRSLTPSSQQSLLERGQGSIVVKQHSGSIEVDTLPGEFTEIRVILPRAAEFVADPAGRA
jgi:hypothetical protein